MTAFAKLKHFNEFLLGLKEVFHLSLLGKDLVLKKKPVFLDLSKIALPLPALCSICHRISGFFLVLSLPFMAFLFYLSLESEKSFFSVLSLKGSFGLGSFWLLGCLIALSYHCFAGVRHLLMDLHFFEELKSAQRSAKVLFILFFFEIFLLILWFWEVI